MNYSDIAAVDTYALSKGEVDFLTCDDTGVSAAVNAAGGYSAAAVSLVLDGLSTPNFIEKNHLLYIGSEYMLVTDVTFATETTLTVTVTRGMYGTIAAAIADDALVSVRNMLKVRLINMATQDIVNTHKQYLTEDLWMSENAWLVEAEKLHTIQLSKYLAERETAERIGAITSGEFSDGVLTIGGISQAVLSGAAAQLVGYAMKEYRLSRNEWGRG